MKIKKNIGELISVKFTDRKTPIYGIVIDYNDEWTLMKHNFTDYMINGYIIFRHKNIAGFREEKLHDKIVKLKGIKLEKEDLIPLTDLETILKYITQKFGIFELSLRSEAVCYLGSLKSINSKELVIDYLNSRGKWDGEMKFKPGAIRTIGFDTDYANSLKLVSGNKRK